MTNQKFKMIKLVGTFLVMFTEKFDNSDIYYALNVFPSVEICCCDKFHVRILTLKSNEVQTTIEICKCK